MGKPWTEEQEDVIREHRELGAERIAELIFRECGVRRTTHAVEDRASKIHVSLRVETVCPECGVRGLRLNANGICQRCQDRRNLEGELAYQELLAMEVAEATSGPDTVAVLREYQRVRQQNNRTRRRYNLGAKRERRRGGKGCMCPSCQHFHECTERMGTCHVTA